MKGITDRQKEVLTFISNYTEENSYPPTVRDISEHFEISLNPVILEPIMKVSLTGPSEFQGAMFGLINQRRGVIIDSTDENNTSTVNAEVPLSEMFGFSTILRSSTQGKGEFTMEFLKYGKVPNAVSEELIAKHKAEKEAGHNK